MEDTQNRGHCDKALAATVSNNKVVHKLIESIEALGCKIPPDFFLCRHCDGEISGGFVVNTKKEAKDYKPQIVVCENHRLDVETFENTIIHELVHAYDLCRVKELDWTNCRSHACTEVRASSLSGECGFLHEAFRGRIKLENGHRDCVKRRATLSVGMNAGCKEYAKETVESVFEKCYNDVAPFDMPR